MIDSFSVLYQHLANSYGLSPVPLCHLHKPCKIQPECRHFQSTQLLDFDAVKDAYSKKNKIQTGSSVDGLHLRNERFVFIEIKGWKMFLIHQQPVTAEKIKAQVSTYDFESKLLNSMRICCAEAENESFFSGKSIVYMIVTDIDIKENPLETLALNLSALASSSSSVAKLCNAYMEKHISAQNFSENFKNTTVFTFYKNCREVDSFIENMLA